jgi:hypothetical protein
MIFEFFVEWMHYGYYTLASPLLLTNHPAVSLDAQAWVLGDRLRSTELRLTPWAICTHSIPETIHLGLSRTADIRYACAQSAADSKLCQLYNHILAVHFTDKTRVQGSVDEWDDLFLTHVIARKEVLRGFRTSVHTWSTIGKIEEYLERKQDRSADEARLVADIKTIPQNGMRKGPLSRKNRWTFYDVYVTVTQLGQYGELIMELLLGVTMRGWISLPSFQTNVDLYSQKSARSFSSTRR